MEQTKNRWVLKVVLAAVFAFAMTLALTLGIMLGMNMTVYAEETQTRPEDGVWHDQYVDRSAIQVGDVFYADTTSIHIFNDMHTMITVGDHEEVVDWTIALREDGIVTEHYEIPWDGEIVVPFGKVYTYRGTVFDVTNVSGTWFTSGTCIARLDNGVLTVGSKTGFDASMDDHEAGNRAEWCIQPFNSYITKVVVLDKVTWIGDYAFWNLPNLKEVELASSVEVIGNYAFSSSGLETIVIPDTVTSLYSHIFDGCSKLKNVTLPQGANVGDGMFANCGSITDLDIFDGIKSFGAGAFSGCSGLVDVTIPNSVTAIGSSCFSGCGNLKRLVFSDSIKTVPNSVCRGCGNLEEVVIGSGTTYIDNYAFNGCNKLEKAFFNRPSEPNGEVTFAGPIDSQYKIGLPFETCTKLYYTGEPEYMALFRDEYIEEEGKDIQDIQKLYYYIDDKIVLVTLRWLNKNAITTDYSGDCKVVRNWKGVATVSLRDDGGEGNDGSGRMADGYCNWRMEDDHIWTTGVIIEDGVTHIGADSFSVDWIGFITFGADVESIGYNAFAGADVSELNFPSKLKTIGAKAFYENTYLTELTFPDSVTYIGEQAFHQCYALKNVVLPKYLEVLGSQAFMNDPNLESVMTFPKTVTTIGGGAFNGTRVTDANLEMQSGDLNLDYSGLFGLNIHFYGSGDSKLYKVADGTEIVDGSYLDGSNMLWIDMGCVWRVPIDYESGDCLVHFEGLNVTVRPNPNGNGTGEMANSDTLEDRPWNWRIGEILTVEFVEGVTSVGDKAFAEAIRFASARMNDDGIYYIHPIIFVEGLRRIGNESFKNDNIDILYITMPSSLTEVGDRAFGKNGIEATFIRPDHESSIRFGEDAFDTGLFLFEEESGYYSLYSERDVAIMDHDGLDHYNNSTIYWKSKIYELVVNSDNDLLTANVDDNPVTFARQGEKVTLAISSDLDGDTSYAIKEISVYISPEIRRLSDVIALLQDATISPFSDFDEVLFQINGEKIELWKNNELIAELNDDYSVEYLNMGENTEANFRGESLYWDFILYDDKIISFNVGDMFNGVTLYETQVECKKAMSRKEVSVTKNDNEYYFIMPSDNVTVSAKVVALHSIENNSENGSVTITKNGETINGAYLEDVITLTIEPDSGYTFKDIAVYYKSTIITDIKDLVALMGDAEFECLFDELLTVKVNDAGNFVLLNGETVVVELIKPYELERNNDYMDSEHIHYDVWTTAYIWSFSINENGVLSAIDIMERRADYVFRSDETKCVGTGSLTKTIDVTMVTEGKVYTFEMPDDDIEIVVTFDEIPKHDHNETTLEYVAAKDATCTEAGNIAYYRCTVCGELFSDENGQNAITAESTVIPALDHDYKFDSFVWDGFTAQAKYVCSHDNSHIELHDAMVTNEVTTVATCEGKGVRTYTATYDGHTEIKTEEIAAIGHAFTTFDSFVWDGFTAKAKYICSHDETHFELYDAIVTSEVTKAATCTETGVTTHTATYDGHTEIKTEIVEALGHDWGEWIVITEPTNEEEGLERRVCSHDETHVEERAIPVHSHNETTLELVAAKEASCTEAGNIAYYVCKECGKLFKDSNGQEQITFDSTVIPAKGHSYGEVAYVWSADNATCTATRTCGHDVSHVESETVSATAQITQHATCTLPEFTTYMVTFENEAFATQTKANVQTADALGHDYQDVVTAPTCTERGFTTHTCSRCGDSSIDTYVDALGHNFGEWVVTKEAQVGVKGEETRTCSVCGEKETREIAALPYVPTTNDDGEKVYSETLTEEAKDVTELFAQAKEEEGTVEIKTGEIAIVFDKNAVNAIGNSNVSISAQVSTENLNVENAELVIEVTLTGATFADGSATVSIPFAQEVPAGKVAKVYYIADDGTRTDMNATFADGKVSFITNHFSTYAVVFENAAVANGGLSGGAIVGIVLGAVTLLALGGFALVWFVIKKKTWADLLVLFKKK